MPRIYSRKTITVPLDENVLGVKAGTTRIVSLAQQKGGVGKSSCAINLAAQASLVGKTAIIDMDTEQATTMKWGKRRDSVLDLEVATSDVNGLGPLLTRLQADGVKWVFIDLPGRGAGVSGAGMKVSDIILVPCRPLDIDIEASLVTVMAARRGGKSYAYLMNIAPPQVNAQRARKVSEALRNAGHPVCPVVIHQRVQVPDAIAQGMTVIEYEPNGESAAEFAALFKWISREVGE
jgi:chromosome partitioning protein